MRRDRDYFIAIQNAPWTEEIAMDPGDSSQCSEKNRWYARPLGSAGVLNTDRSLPYLSSSPLPQLTGACLIS